MEQSTIIAALSLLFEQYFGQGPHAVVAMPRSGSNRQYFRLQNAQHSAVGVFNDDQKENIAFLSFTHSLAEAGVRVPQILAQNLAQHVYLQTDLGDMTLFEYIQTVRNGNPFPHSLQAVYEKVIRCLPTIQIEGARHIDFDVCYPRAAFDKQSMSWDLNYFKYYFLKLAGVAFDEQDLETDFTTFTQWLLQSPGEFFLYRDFQSRNILLVDGEPVFIDYQGGRRGALQYDIASLLYDAKAGLPESARETLLHCYLDELERHQAVDRAQFMQFFYGFVLIRIMQAMGAYGYRGFFERKEHFLQSIPYALDNMAAVVAKIDFPVALPTLQIIWRLLPTLERLRTIGTNAQKLKLKVQSFSYKKGLPVDKTEHGGGFIFDCRSIHNPGRYEEFKTKSGLDADIRDFFAKEPEMELFLADVYNLVDRAVAKYIDRKFNYLAVSFGCTGGQHRSVYCAESLAAHLKSKFDLSLEIEHRERDYWKK